MANARTYSVIPGVVFETLRSSPLFRDMDAETVREAASGWSVEYFPSGTVIVREGDPDPRFVYLIHKGAVKLWTSGGNGKPVLADFGGEGFMFGAYMTIETGYSPQTIEAVEDVYCFALARQDFAALLWSRPDLLAGIQTGFSAAQIAQADIELRSNLSRRSESHFGLCSRSIAHIVRDRPESVSADITIQEAAARMAVTKSPVLLLHDAAQRIVGIVTDQDLRHKVVAAGLSPRAEARRIMTAPVLGIDGALSCFEALLTMMRHGADHLVVKSGDQIIGAVGVRDIMVSQGVSPLFLLREMASQETVEGLAATCAKIPHVIQLLVEGGAKAWDAAAAAAALEKAAMSRILGILTRGLGKPAAPFAVVAFGRQGRREQVFPEAQRNGIMFAPVDDESERETQRFLDELGPMIVEALVLCGYPEGAGDMTCARAKWRATIREWEKRYDGWMSGPVPENAHRNLEFFDALPLYGEDRAVKALLRRVRKRTGARPLFELHLACECLSKRPPLTFLRDSVINKSGEKFPRLDLRAQLIDPIVRFARLWAMRHEIGETNTVMRLSRLADQGFIPRDLFADLKDSFEFASRLMLIHQLEHARKGLIPDSFIRPSILSDIEKRTLKEAFRVMDRMLSFIKHTLRSAVYADSR